jgi:hypothetical protein
MKNWIKIRQAYNWITTAGLAIMITGAVVTEFSDAGVWETLFPLGALIIFVGLHMEIDHLRSVIRKMEAQG